MGAFLDKPKTDKHNEYGNGNGLRYGIASMQGWRLEMEDAHQAIIGLPGGDDQCNEFLLDFIFLFFKFIISFRL